MIKMGQVKQSVLSKIIHSNYFTRTKSVVCIFVSQLTQFSRIFYSQTTPQHLTLTNMQEPINHYLIVGLGNYGFGTTRHSIGMKAVDMLANKLNIKWEQCNGFIASTKLDHIHLTLFKPKALMNVNGRSVGRIAHQLSLKPANIYLIHDELDRVPGKFHIKEGGSAGGHNGVLSCMDALGSKDMMRLRIGIGRPSTKALVVPYVLSRFSKEESATVDVAIHQGLEYLLDHINKRSTSTKPPLAKRAAKVLDPAIDKNKYHQDSPVYSQSGNLETESVGCMHPVSHTSIDTENSEANTCRSDNVNNLQDSDRKCVDREPTPER